MAGQHEFHRGGYIPGTPTVVHLDPEECFIGLADIRAGRVACSRPSHADRACPAVGYDLALIPRKGAARGQPAQDPGT